MQVVRIIFIGAYLKVAPVNVFACPYRGGLHGQAHFIIDDHDSKVVGTNGEKATNTHVVFDCNRCSQDPGQASRFWRLIHNTPVVLVLAQHLPHMDTGLQGGKADPYITFDTPGEQQQTSTIEKKKLHEWNEAFVFNIDKHDEKCGTMNLTALGYETTATSSKFACK